MARGTGGTFVAAGAAAAPASGITPILAAAVSATVSVAMVGYAVIAGAVRRPGASMPIGGAGGNGGGGGGGNGGGGGGGEPTPNDNDSVNNDGGSEEGLDYCPMWSVTEPQAKAIAQRVFPLIDNLKGDADFDSLRRQNGGKTAEEAGWSRGYYRDLALWLAANMDDFGGITKTPRPLPVGPCVIVGPDQKALLKGITDYFISVIGDW